MSEWVFVVGLKAPRTVLSPFARAKEAQSRFRFSSHLYPGQGGGKEGNKEGGEGEIHQDCIPTRGEFPLLAVAQRVGRRTRGWLGCGCVERGVGSPARHIPRGPIPRALFIRSINPSYRAHPRDAAIGRAYDFAKPKTRAEFMAVAQCGRFLQPASLLILNFCPRTKQERVTRAERGARARPQPLSTVSTPIADRGPDPSDETLPVPDSFASEQLSLPEKCNLAGQDNRGEGGLSWREQRVTVRYGWNRPGDSLTDAGINNLR